MKTIVLTNHYDEAPLSILREIVGDRFRLITLEKSTRDHLLSHVEEADYLLVSGRISIDEEILKKAGKLRMVQRTGVGLDNMDLRYLKENGIPLYVNAGVNANSVAEHTLMLMLSVLRKAAEADRKIKDGIWEKQKLGVTTHEIRGKTIGLIGMGSIGSRVAELLVPFGANVIYYQRHRLTDEREKELGIRYEDFETLIRTADIISLHCPYSISSGTLIGREELEKMKKGVFLINTARGKLIDEKALADALKEGKAAGAGLDVFETEPIPADSPILSAPNTSLTSHIGGITYESFRSMMEKAIRNIISFDEGDLAFIEENKYITEE